MRKLLVLVLGLALLATSCMTVNYTPSASSRPVSFTGEVKGQRTHFTDEKVLWYVLWGLVPISDNDIEKGLIEPRTANGAVQNLSIKSEMSALDVVISFFTSLVSITRQTVTVDGDLVR